MKKKRNVRSGLAKVLDIPKEILLNVPKITMYAGCEMGIENYSGISEYTAELIRVNTGSGSYKISGRGMEIIEITTDELLIKGTICNIEIIC